MAFVNLLCFLPNSSAPVSITIILLSRQTDMLKNRKLRREHSSFFSAFFTCLLEREEGRKDEERKKKKTRFSPVLRA